MSIDLSKLNPAPWGVHDGGREDYTVCEEHEDDTCNPLFENIGPDDKGLRGEFVCLARAAFDVMMRRGWWPERFDSGRWATWTDRGWGKTCDDPFTALVEADRWYKENVEK